VPSKTIRERVADVIEETLMLIEGAAVPAASMETLGADSLDVVDIMIGLELEFDIEISDDDEFRLSKPETTVNDLVEFVEGRVKN
jgi:acyl carrier protein